MLPGQFGDLIPGGVLQEHAAPHSLTLNLCPSDGRTLPALTFVTSFVHNFMDRLS